MTSFEDLLGIRFKVHGRDLNGFDCYGFQIYYAKRCGHYMPDLYKDYTEETYMHEMAVNAPEFIIKCNLIKTDRPKCEDAILFYDDKGRVCHIGTYLKNGDFVHCDMYGVRVSNINNFYRKKFEVYTWQQ